MHREQYIHKLQSRGYEMLGKGLYSSVLAIPNTNRVIKVGEMDEWPSYIIWATRNGHAGKFAPMVYSLKFHGTDYNAFYVAIMERLVCTIREIKFPMDANENNLPRVNCDQSQAYNSMWSGGPPDLVEYVKELASNSLVGDLHDANVMVRHDGSLVVTDPVSGHYSGTDRPRIKSGTCL